MGAGLGRVAAVTGRIDIRELMQQFCERLGIPYEDTARIEFEPGDVKAVVYLRNENGSKYVGEDGYAAAEERTFRVWT